MRHAASVVGLALVVGACGGASPAAQRPLAVPGASNTETTQKQSDDKILAAKPRADVLYPAPPIVPRSPETCSVPGPLPEPRLCPGARAALASALASPKGSELALLEGCSEYPRGLLRALRAELGAPECADRMVAPLVAQGQAEDPALGLEIRELLTALGLGAELERLARDPPALPKERSKDAILAHLKETLFPWITAQAEALGTIARQGAALRGYARGIVAIEAGMADMRFVELVRAVPLPEEMAGDAEVRDIYYSSLDEALEPRKTRGRDAALVGLRELARAGVLFDRRVEEARRLLTQVFGGSRVASLDALLIPQPRQFEPATIEEKIAGAIPTAYQDTLLADAKLTPPLLTALGRQGLSPGFERAARDTADTELRRVFARLLFQRGRIYFQAKDFQDLVRLFDEKALTNASSAAQDEGHYYRALGQALAAGPSGTLEVMAKGPRFAEALGNLEALDALAMQEAGAYAGMAAYNGAYLRALTAAPDAATAWSDIAVRFERAVDLLKKGHPSQFAFPTPGASDPPLARARELARAARATALAVQPSRQR